MRIEKARFLEPGAPPYHPTPLNLFVYDRWIRTPSVGMLTLATIVRSCVADTFFIGIFTFSAPRGYELADRVRRESDAVVVIGGLHATMVPEEAAAHCDYVLLGEGDETILQLVDALEAGEEPGFPGVAWEDADGFHSTGLAPAPHDLDVVPDRDLLYRYRAMAGHNTIWGQVHASRGCPHDCGYCSLVRLYGHRVRTRSPENVVEDIRRTIAFHDQGHRRLARMLWLTDDNFFADRAWALEVLHAIVDSDIDYRFTIQARYEVGFDDEMLDLLAQAGFVELSLGIEFVDDSAFAEFHKRSTRDAVTRSIGNIQAHGLRVRGLFIFGSESDRPGIGARVADFAIECGIRGVLLQSMYFVPGTPAYDAYRDRLLHHDWSKCVGNVVHRPCNISPAALQREVIEASRRFYSPRRLLRSLVHDRGIDRILFIGEFFWQMSERSRMRRELANLPEN